jgi:hypothetical protein
MDRVEKNTYMIVEQGGEVISEKPGEPRADARARKYQARADARGSLA